MPNDPIPSFIATSSASTVPLNDPECNRRYRAIDVTNPDPFFPGERKIDATCRVDRPHVPALDRILGHAFPVLDHGFLRCVDYMGDDAAVVQAARTSYARGTKTAQKDAGLIRYLMRHWHTTPFEMCEIKLHVKLPIFVARQWIRHRTASVNEMSARYSILDGEFYIPAPEHLAAQSSVNNQGRGAVLGENEAAAVLDILRDDALRAYGSYEEMLRDDDEAGKLGLARELARMNLPTNIYTQWYWKTDLHNLFHFLRLRADSHAQYEIRAYAEVICDIAQVWVPHSYAAFADYRLNAVQFSAQEMTALREIIIQACPNGILGAVAKKHLIEKGGSQREADEFLAKLHVQS